MGRLTGIQHSEETHPTNGTSVPVGQRVSFGKLHVAVGLLVVATLSASVAAEAQRDEKRILLMLDGVTPDTFEAAKERGRFARFGQHAAHVAPFPSISDYAWSEVLQARQVLGTPGRIRHYEAAFFDEGEGRAHEDGRFFFHRLANPVSAYGAVDTMLNPFIEGLAYFPTTEIRNLELAQIERDLERTDMGPVAVAFFTVPDAIAHTRPEQLPSYLDAIDAMIERIVKVHAERGDSVRIDLIADHGQTGAHDATGAQVPLVPIELSAVAARAGLVKRDALDSPNAVVFPVLALGSYTGGWTPSHDVALALARAQRGHPDFDIAVVRVPPARADVRSVVVIGQRGEATLDVVHGASEVLVRYGVKNDDPLSIPPTAANRWLPITSSEFETLDARPFAIPRIARTVLEEEAAMPDILISFRDGFRIAGPLEGLTTMYQTHGSLSKSASLGVLATTDREKLPAFVLSEDVLDVLNLPAASLYPETSIVRSTSLPVSKPESHVVKTASGDLSGRAVFHRMTRVSDLSTAIVREDLADAVLALLPSNALDIPGMPTSKSLTASGSDVDWRRLLTAEEIANAIDALLSTEDVGALANHPTLNALPSTVLDRLKERTRQKKSSPPSPSSNDADQAQAAPPSTSDGDGDDNNDDEHDEHDEQDDAVDMNAVGVAGRMALMRAHGIRALLDRALTVAERSAIADSRDHQFAAKWHAQKRVTPVAAPEDARERERSTLIQLFGEIHRERNLAGDVFPAPLSPLYPVSPRTADAVTVVYFPGIYDEVFDGQIFREGLMALDDLGIRVLEVPSRGSCSAAINAAAAADFLVADAAQRRARGHSVTPYVFFGYSKGAVDALHLIANRPQWTENNVLALVAIAAPLQGAQVLARRDLGPKEFAVLTGALPSVDCREPKSAAGPSVTAAAMNAFFSEHGQTIADKTRFFSVSFEATLKEAHLWMKLTKNLAGFTGPNDGVVAVEASRFPDTIDALDLGTLRADHLAGLPTAAGQFDQRALFESLVIFLQEAGGFSSGTAQSFRDRARAHSPWASVDDRIAHLNAILERVDIDLKTVGKKGGASSVSIEQALNHTPYAVGPFRVDTVASKPVAIALRSASFLGIRYQSESEPISIDDDDAFARAILGPLRDDGRNLAVVSKERWRALPKSDRPRFKPPPNNLAFDVDARINLRNLGDMLDGKVISPITPTSHPRGIPLVMDRRRVASFRSEFEFYWEDLSPPGADDNRDGGWSTDVDTDGRVMAVLNSANTSARMTSFSMRFRPVDFPQLDLTVAIDKNTVGADVTRGGSGRDDSAFQIWFVVREISDGAHRSTFAADEQVRLFGYYWSDDDATPTGSIVENTYSQRDLVVVRLPHAKQLSLGNTVQTTPTRMTRNLAEDLAAAFPRANVKKLEVVAVTFQHDSNDTQTSSRARFYQATLAPLPVR